MPETRVISLRNDLSDLRRLAIQIEEFGRAHGFDREWVLELNLTLEEITTNIIRHGYREGGEHPIDIRLDFDGDTLCVQVADEARPFDPLRVPAPDIERPLEERPVGGLGILLVRRLMDEVSYRRERGRNILTLRKRMPPC